MDGMFGDQFILEVQYSKCDGLHNVKFFVKSLAESIPLLFEMTKEMLAYEKEAFFYDTLVPLMKQQGLECKYAPRSFLCEPYKVVLEHLGESSFMGSGKNKTLDYSHCRVCMETLAQFHSDAILFERVRSEQMGREYNILDEFPLLKTHLWDSPKMAKLILFSVEALYGVIDVIPEGEISSNTFKQKLGEVVREIMSSPGSQEFRSIITHRDLWSNNFLFLYDDNAEIKDCKLVDYQTIGYGPPAEDILLFILCNTTKEFRQQHEKNLVTHYYNHLSQLLRNKGIAPAEVLSEGEFWQTRDIYRVPAKLHAMLDRCFTCVSEERFSQAAQSDESFSRFLFEDRGKYILQEFEG
ncbi:hypothetical protein JTB14_027859 [Gonioctena quinquepunctata]|nr:hypothetical protein JTB14_027859 [Gonioctena quinquepunctata]